MSQVDLHVHSNASDGKYSPTELVRMAVAAGLKYLAICDHDSMEGIPEAVEAAKAFPGLTVISGVEINTYVPTDELHILGYFCDPDDMEMKERLAGLRESRVERAKKMVSKLRKMGMKIDFERLQEIAGEGSIGRPHVASALKEKGYVNNTHEAFEKYISRGCPAYVERDKLKPQEAIQLIISSGGVPVLAHPLHSTDYLKHINEIKPAGLQGLEIYYKNLPEGPRGELLKTAGELGLIATGGSDFHGSDSASECLLGAAEVPLECAQVLYVKACREAPKDVD